MNRLAGKVAVITGAGSGIGRASARLFVAEGAKVVVADIDEALGEASASEAGARFVRTDVTDDASVERMVQQAKDAFGRIDVLLNCAGGSLGEDKPVTNWIAELRVRTGQPMRPASGPATAQPVIPQAASGVAPPPPKADE